MKMFVAGPVNIDKRIRNVKVPDIGHREPEFEQLYDRIKKKSLKIFKANNKDYEVVVVGGSGTAAIETVVSSVLPKSRKTLVVSNGAFGERIGEICKIYGLPTVDYKMKWGEYPDLGKLEKLLKQKDVEAMTMVHMETSTGMLNPIHDAGALCDKYNKMFIVDSISALGGEKLDVVEDSIDFCVTNTNKCVGGVPVLGLVCSRKLRLDKLQRRNMYLDLGTYLAYSRKNQTPFTPQIPLFFALDKTLDVLLEEGLVQRQKRLKENGDTLKKGLRDMGLKFYLDKHMSNLMVNVMIPDGASYTKIHDDLKERGYIIYPGKDELHGKVIHIANMGTLKKKDIMKFNRTLQRHLHRGEYYE